jgi:hypothetical protein
MHLASSKLADRSAVGSALQRYSSETVTDTGFGSELLRQKTFFTVGLALRFRNRNCDSNKFWFRAVRQKLSVQWRY